MFLIAQILIALVLLIHLYILLLETVLFKTRGRKVFGIDQQRAEIMAPAMLNQGIYNGFLAAALAVGFTVPHPAIGLAFFWFGLGCVAVAGIVGALTVSKRILFVQTVPAVAAMIALLLAK